MNRNLKRTVLAASAGVVLLGTLVSGALWARADEHFNPDCHLQGINRDLDSAIGQIRSSPAYGHAAGHYAKAIQDLEQVKTQLHDGCGNWNMSMHH
jgi:hypothetical protein